MAVPEKPTLDGLEEKWAPAGRSRARTLRPHDGRASDVYAIDTPPPTVTGALHMGHVFCYTHTDTVARFQRMRGRRSSTRWAGTTTACPPSAGCRTTTASAATRPCRTTRTSSRPTSTGRATGRSPISRRNFVELCQRLTAEDEQAFEALWRRLGLSVDWSLTYTTIGDRVAARPRSGRSCATSPAARPTRPRRRRCGTSTSAPRSRRPSSRTASGRGAYHRLRVPRPGRRPGLDRDHPARAAAGLRRPGRPPRRRALRSRCSAPRVRTPVFGVEVPVLAHRLADPDKGTGIAMVCTFGDTHRRHLVARAAACRPARCSAGTAASGAEPPPARACAAGRGAPTPARTANPGTAARSSSCSARPATLDRRAAPDHPPGQVLREGRPPARDRHQPPVVHPQRRPGRRRCATRCWPAAASCDWHPDVHAAPLRELGRRACNGDWLVSRQRFFGVPFPVWYPLDDEGEPDHDQPARSPTEDRAAGRPVSRTCPPATTRPSAACPGGFIGDPDVMDTWATSSLTPQIAGGWETTTDLFARVFPMDLRPQGPRDHPHLAVLHRAAVPPRARRRCPGRTPRYPAGSSTPTARRCRSRRATSSRR